MKLKKIYALILIFSIVLCLFCGCDRKVYITTGLKDNEIFKLSSNPCNVGEIMLILMAEKNRYESDFGVDIWQYKSDDLNQGLDEEIKDKVKQQLIKVKTIELFAKKHKVVLSDEEKALLKEAAKTYYSTLTKEEKDILKVKESDVLSLYTSFYMADMVYYKLTKDIDIEVSDEEARVVKCKYIFIDSREDKNTSYEKALTVQALLSAGNDFNMVAKEHSDSAEINAELSRKTIYAQFEETIFSMTQGQISPILENEDGYYIFLCVSDYMESETMANKIKIADDYKKSEYEKKYNPFEADQTLEFNDKVWDKVKIEEYSEVTTDNLYKVYNEYFK